MFRGWYVQRRLGRIESPDDYIRCSLPPKYCAGARALCVWLGEAGSGRGPVGNIARGAGPVTITARLPRPADRHARPRVASAAAERVFKLSLLEAFTACHLERAVVSGPAAIAVAAAGLAPDTLLVGVADGAGRSLPSRAEFATSVQRHLIAVLGEVDGAWDGEPLTQRGSNIT